MKQILGALLVLAIMLPAKDVFGQISTPAASPQSKVTQLVGLTNFTLEYSRPSTRGRKIFGELLPYGVEWRTGANGLTTLTFDKPVMVGGKELAAGSYSISSIPGKSEWSVSLSQGDTKVVTMNIKPVNYPVHIETLSLQFEKITDTSTEFQILWENTLIPIPIMLKTDEQVMAQIDQFSKDPEASLANAYYQAASYYLSTNRDLDKALEWVNKATANGGTFWQLRTKALILAGLGRYKEAIAVAETSTSKSKEAGNADYPRLNGKSIAEWKGKM